jgi:hypothetical protein
VAIIVPNSSAKSKGGGHTCLQIMNSSLPTSKMVGKPKCRKKNLRKALYGSFENRAMMYYCIFYEMRKEIGALVINSNLRTNVLGKGDFHEDNN